MAALQKKNDATVLHLLLAAAARAHRIDRHRNAPGGVAGGGILLVYGHLSGQHAAPTRGAKRLGHPGSVIGDERLLCYSNYDYAINEVTDLPAAPGERRRPFGWRRFASRLTAPGGRSLGWVAWNLGMVPGISCPSLIVLSMVRTEEDGLLRQKTQVGGRSSRAVVARPMACSALGGEPRGDLSACCVCCFVRSITILAGERTAVFPLHHNHGEKLQCV